MSNFSELTCHLTAYNCWKGECVSRWLVYMGFSGKAFVYSSLTVNSGGTLAAAISQTQQQVARSWQNNFTKMASRRMILSIFPFPTCALIYGISLLAPYRFVSHFLGYFWAEGHCRHCQHLCELFASCCALFLTSHDTFIQ